MKFVTAILVALSFVALSTATHAGTTVENRVVIEKKGAWWNPFSGKPAEVTRQVVSVPVDATKTVLSPIFTSRTVDENGVIVEKKGVAAVVEKTPIVNRIFGNRRKISGASRR